MTPEQIRGEAIERIALALHTEAVKVRDFEIACQLPQARFVHGAIEPLEPYDTTADLWRKIAAPIVDALAELLPTSVRYAVARSRDELTTPRCIGEPLPHCDSLAADFDTVVIRQYLGEWVPNA